MDVGIYDAWQNPTAGQFRNYVRQPWIKFGLNNRYLARRDADIEMPVLTIGRVQYAPTF